MEEHGIGISPEGYIDIVEVADKLGVGVTTAWRLARKSPDFPKKLKLGARRSRWNEDEIDDWIAAKIEAAREEADDAR